MKDRQMSEHFMLSEFLSSQTAARHGIDMTPPDYVVLNLERLCGTVLEPVRRLLKLPMRVSSGYRPPALNLLIGGARTSAHMDGRAADIVFQVMQPNSVVAALKHSTILSTIDQLIDEYGEWTHFGIEVLGDTPRNQVMTARHIGGNTVYTNI